MLDELVVRDPAAVGQHELADRLLGELGRPGGHLRRDQQKNTFFLNKKKTTLCTQVKNKSSFFFAQTLFSVFVHSVPMYRTLAFL
jgi:hypothetical protein